MAAIPYEGRWKCRVIEAALEDSKTTDSVCLAIKIWLDELWYGESSDGPAGFYLPQKHVAVEAVARVWIIRANGDVNESGVGQIKDAFGWDGDWNALTDGSIDWPSFVIQVDVKPETYEGVTKLKPGWVYPADAIPGIKIGSIDQNKAKELAARYGAATRALCAGAPTKPASSSPPSPSRTKDKLPF